MGVDAGSAPGRKEESAEREAGGSPRWMPLRCHWQRKQGRATGRETGAGLPEGKGGAPPRPADPLPSRSSAKGGVLWKTPTIVSEGPASGPCHVLP